MRGRWQVLAMFAALGLAGLLVGMAIHGFMIDGWVVLTTGGLGLAFGLSVWAAVRDCRQRWPAAAALASISPIAWQIVVAVSKHPQIIDTIDPAGFTMIFGVSGTVICAITFLVTKIPPEQPPPITPAKIA